LNIKTAFEKVTDLFGARGVTNGSDAATDEIIDNLTREIGTKGSSVVITEIRNYRGEIGGKTITPYLKGEHISQILKAKTAVGIKNISVHVREGKGKVSDGYTAAHILGIKRGIPFELQIKGNLVKQIDDGTHLLHEIDQGKPLKLIDKRLGKITELYRSLSEEQVKRYKNYIAKAYKAARDAELAGNPVIKFPDKPRTVPEELRIQNLIELAEELKIT